MALYSSLQSGINSRRVYEWLIIQTGRRPDACSDIIQVVMIKKPMSESEPLNINLKEPFPHLPGAPIVEAIIHWQTRATKSPESLLKSLQEELDDYPNLQMQRRLQIQFQFQSQAEPDSVTKEPHDEWQGYRFESADHLYVAQFTRDGFIFNRLAPYENWEKFSKEAMRVWQIYVKFMGPSNIERLGVRFINRIVPIELNDLHRHLAFPPSLPYPLQFPLRAFMHQNKFNVPGYHYNLNVAQTIQQPTPEQPNDHALILDIDVFTTNVIKWKTVDFNDCLSGMRWLKNKMFFTFLTESAIECYKEEQSDD